MQLLVVFLLVAAVAGQFSRSFDWRTYVLLGGAATALTVVYYFSSGLW
ncbi:MAG: hypothetical protein ACYDEB_06610 [Dehalococcoidia bacterium]